MAPETLAGVGIGPTGALSLRLSVASLVRVLFANPRDGTAMLALERKATLVETAQEPMVEVKAQPFGGAVRIVDMQALQALIGAFHFDSERSRSEGDFRLFIQPSSWPALRELCLERLGCEYDPVLESDPGRELTEEFFDALGIKLLPGQYESEPTGLVVEGQPQPTGNPRARGYPTARVYRVFEAWITDPPLAQVLLDNSEGVSDQALCERALRDAGSGGKGRANAAFALPLGSITSFYVGLSPNERNQPVNFEGHQLDETVAAVLAGIRVPKYQRL
ncbi:MAG: hypothetical protein K0B06_11720 [Brevefilum sp.]|nr:hypothetical protein [Brevefilum sp.]